jgi:hypothetical protein
MAAGKVVPFSEELLNQALQNPKQNALDGKSIPDYIKP